MNPRAQLAAGMLLANRPDLDRDSLLTDSAGELEFLLGPSTIWQPARLPPEMRGAAAYGDELVRWRSDVELRPTEEAVLETAWRQAVERLGAGPGYLRLRVDSPAQASRLRALGSVDGLMIVPSLDSRGRFRSLVWRWPFRAGVVPGPASDEWLSVMQGSSHHGTVFDAELADPSRSYELVLVNAADLLDLSTTWLSFLDGHSCVLASGDGPGSADLLLADLEERVQPTMAMAVVGPIDRWWTPLFHELTHNAPLDVAVEVARRSGDVDAVLAGPRWGLDVTAAGRWFAAVAPELPADAQAALLNLDTWSWRAEREGSTDGSVVIRRVRESGADPLVSIPALTRAARPAHIEPGDTDPAEEVVPPPRPGEHQSDAGRRLVARVWDGTALVAAILPPQRNLTFAIRIALPELGDVAAQTVFPPLPPAPGPTATLQVVVQGAVWPTQPEPQDIELSIQHPNQASTWAAFPFTSPDAGELVSITITVLYAGKPLQKAVYTSAVRTFALPGESPVLTTYALTGPDEPTEGLRPVDATLDGCGAELHHVDGSPGVVLITDVQAKLDVIEDRVSRVLGVRDAPTTFDDPRAVDLLIDIARLGVQLEQSLKPLGLDDAVSINVLVNADSRVLPLELAYAGPAPSRTRAKLCRHIDDPPAQGQSCDRVSTSVVCPYAFWGLHRSIARTVSSEGRGLGFTRTAQAFTPSILYASSKVADDGATIPLPSDSIVSVATQAFPPVTRVTNWRQWRSAVKTHRPSLLVVLGHAVVEGGETALYIGKNSAIARVDISPAVLRAPGSAPPLVLLIACATAALGDPFGSLPGALTTNGAGAVVATLAKIVGPQGATAIVHLLDAFHQIGGSGASVGDALTLARRSLIADKSPMGLILVAHGEIDTLVA